MFYLNYLKSELLRRWGKTLMMSLGLAIAGAIIIAIISLSQSLSSSQDKVLNPLQSVGTDIIVSRSVDSDSMRSMDDQTRQEVMNKNRISTDLSKLGNPGEQFSNDAFTPGTMLTFSSDILNKLKIPEVKKYAQGLILNVTHQEGKIPQVTATFETGGEKIDVEGTVSNDDMQAAFDEARTKAEAAVKAKGLDPNSAEGRRASQRAMREYMPRRNFRTQITTERRTYTQDVGHISTDIETTNFTVAGVDTAQKGIGLILPNQITSGSYFNDENQIILNQTYAQKNNININDKYTLNKKEFTVIGLVDPKLYTNTADMYLPLAVLQSLTDNQNKVNVILVKSANSSNVEVLSKKISSFFTGAKTTDSSDTAKQVTGSLVSAANLTNRFIGITSIIVILASFIIVSLLTVLSVNKRTREIGTLKAIGWQNFTIIRQILSENIITGIIGAALGVSLGIIGTIVLNNLNITLSADIAQTTTNLGFGMARRMVDNTDLANKLQTTVDLEVTYNYLVLLLGAGIALFGSIIAGGLAAYKSSRMRAQEALRNLE